MAADQKPEVEQIAAQAASLSAADLSLLVRTLASQTEAITKIANQTENGPVRQVSLAKATYRTPWNPSGTKKRPKLTRPTFLSGSRLREALMSANEINLCNALTAGTYHNDEWIVVVKGGDKQKSAVEIYIPNKTIEQRLELKNHVRNLEDLLDQIVNEAKTRDAANRSR